MACVKDSKLLSPDEKKIGQALEREYLSVDEIVAITNLPLFKVRSGIRKLLQHDFILEKDGKYMQNKAD